MDEVHKIIAEGNALTRALAVIEAGASPAEARRLCAHYLERHHEPDNLENIVIDCALRRICGLLPTTYNTTHVETNDTLEEVILRAGVVRWVRWVSDIPICMPPSEGTQRVSELDRMALTHWFEGVENLSRGNTTEGRRFFRRAAIFGGTYGTSSNPIIQWTYAASFFPVSS